MHIERRLQNNKMSIQKSIQIIIQSLHDLEYDIDEQLREEINRNWEDGYAQGKEDASKEEK